MSGKGRKKQAIDYKKIPLKQREFEIGNEGIRESINRFI